MSYTKLKRTNRYSVNLNDDESQLIELAAKATGVHPSVIVRQLAMSQAIETLVSEETLSEFNLLDIINKGAQTQLSGS